MLLSLFIDIYTADISLSFRLHVNGGINDFLINEHKLYVAYRNGVSITAGQDRRVAVDQENQDSYYLKSDFLVYCVGLSPSAEIGIYTDGEDNYLQIFNIQTKQKGH